MNDMVHVLGVLIRRQIHNGPREFVKIADVKVPIRSSKNPHLVPAGFVDLSQPPVVVHTLKWMLQKDLLKQDIFLIGVPGSIRSSVVFEFLELCNREFEYLSITRDTTEADIKQRREIRSGNAFYTDLCAVRAALNGRVLVIDGVEKAERNVLPILNNLLENREMQLDDGRFLMAADKFDKLLEKYSLDQLKSWGLERVSENFSVIALGLSVPPFVGHSLDPPLRSRFQCRNLTQLPFETMLALCQLCAPNVASSRISNLLSLIYGLNSLQPEFQVSTANNSKDSAAHAKIGEMPLFPVDNIRKAVQIWNNNTNYTEEFVFGLCYPPSMLLWDSQRPILNDFLAKFALERETKVNGRIVKVEPSEEQSKIATARVSFEGDSHSFKVPFGGRKSSPNFEDFVSSPTNERLLADLLLSHSQTDFCLLGPKGSGKSTIVREFAHRLQYDSTETVVLYQDMNSRELLQRRRMLENGDTVWEDSQLVSAAKQGTICVLDGIDRVHWSMAEVLAPLVHHRFLELPDGNRLVGSFGYELLKHRTGLSEEGLRERNVHKISENFRIIALGDSESASKWLNEQMLALFVYHSLQPMSIEEKLQIITKQVPNVCTKTASKLFKLVDKLAHSSDASVRAIATSLSLRRLVHILKRHSIYPDEGIYHATQRAALARFLPPIVKKTFESSLATVGINPPPREQQIIPRAEENWSERLQKELSPSKDAEHQSGEGDKRSFMVPSTLFFDNVQHLRVINDMARDFQLGSHLLLIGNQGVGKNKVTDRFLQLINRPRKYMQLHRDTTVQSLTVQTSVVEGVLKYEDSPLVQAVREGLVLVIDEADKAPLHVVSILKSLLDSETLYLADGRRICAQRRDNDNEDGKTIYVHKDFQMIMLANRPGFPFLGNDLYGLLGDLFAVHYLDNPSKTSELSMLAQYGPDVPNSTLELLVDIFGELRSMADQSLLSYPYSTRELVNVVKHLQHFPRDSIQQAVRNVFDFDSFSQDTAETIQEVFTRKGVPLSIGAIGQAFGDATAYDNWSRLFGLGAEQATDRIEIERDGSVFDLSKLDDPKFGKIDPTNAPHIGGNTWAGGVGGYNTAGLGGVGGPFRLDAGHTVHQLPDSAKAQVPEHILKKAREIAKQEYAKKLKEIEMSEYDAEAYDRLYKRVSRQVKMLKAIIESLETKQHERQWAKHQTSGDLDDAKLIEGMTGERNIYRKRIDKPPDQSMAPKPKRIRFCFDVSGSMYRFNGYDQRLQRAIESAMLVMEALDGKTEKIKYDIVGHSGENAEIPFISLDKAPKNEKERLDILQKMIAHSQFCMSGDNTVEAMEMAIKRLKSEQGDFDERFVVLLSDANLDRYGIRPSHLRKALSGDESVNAFVILIGSLGPNQALTLQKALPPEKAFVATDAAQIPEIMQKIFSATIMK